MKNSYFRPSALGDESVALWFALALAIFVTAKGSRGRLSLRSTPCLTTSLRSRIFVRNRSMRIEMLVSEMLLKLCPLSNSSWRR